MTHFTSPRQIWRIQMQWELASCIPVRDFSRRLDLEYLANQAVNQLSANIELARYEIRNGLAGVY